jgi:hypothetical protein
MSMKLKELAIAIDTERLAQNRSEPVNPCFCAVPPGLTTQEVLEFVYKSAIEYSLELLDEEPELPTYDYLWYGSVGKDGVVSGSECDRITPLGDEKIRRMISEARRKIGGNG